MSHKEWMPLLVKYFNTIRTLDNEIEIIRNDLTSNVAFHPRTIFNYIDQNSQNFLTLSNFRNYLNEKFISFEEQSLRRFIHNFDKDFDFSIDYEEFLQIILPKKNISLQNQVLSRNFKNNEILINENIFLTLITKELELVKILSEIADELKYAKNFTTYESFLAVSNDEKYLTKENLKYFLMKNGVNVSDIESQILLFRIDQDNDGKISYEEFQDIFFPYKDKYDNVDMPILNDRVNHYNINNMNKNFHSFADNNNFNNNNYNDNVNYDDNNNNNENNEQFINKSNTFTFQRTNNFKRPLLKSSSNIDINSLFPSDITRSPLNYNYKYGKTKRLNRTNSMDYQVFKHDPCGNNASSFPNYKPYANNNVNNSNILMNSTNISTSLMNSNSNNNFRQSPKRKENSPDQNFSSFSNEQIIHQQSIPNEENYIKRLNSYTSPNHSNNNIPLRTKTFNNSMNNSNIIYNSNNNLTKIKKVQSNSYFIRSPRNSLNRSNVISSPILNKCECPPKQMCSCNKCLNPCSCCCLILQLKQNISNLLCDFINQDNRVENLKQKLAYCNDANLSDLFEFFDYSKRNCISCIDMFNALKEINLNVDVCDLKFIFRRYDKNFDSHLDYDEFCDMILPKKYSIAKIMSEKTVPNVFNGFNYETKKILFDIFNAMIQGEKSNENYRQCLYIGNCNLCDIFNLLKNKLNDGIFKEDLINFLQQNGKILQPFEIDLLVDRLDKDQDGMINYNEFVEEFALKC